MAGNKRHVEPGNRYQRLVAVLVVAEMLHGNDAVAVRLEDEEKDGWDDIVETVDADGVLSERRTQVKAGVSLERDELQAMLLALGDGRARILAYQIPTLKTPKVGRLRELCRLAAPEHIPTDEGREILAWLRTAVPDVDDVRAYLRPLRGRFLGDALDLEWRARGILTYQYDDEAFGVLLNLVDHAMSHGGELQINEVRSKLGDLERLAPVPATLYELRQRHLRELIDDADRSTPLDGLLRELTWKLDEVAADRLVFDGEAALPLDEHVDAALANGDCKLFLHGEMGSGKSVTIRNLARRLARRAVEDDGYATPILTTARELLSSPSEEALGPIWASRLPVILLVDGLDEVRWDQRRDRALRMAGNRPGLLGLIGAGRTGSLPHNGRHLALREWSDLEVERFLEAWAAFDPEAASIVRRSAAARALAHNPLLATYALAIATLQPQALARRHELLGAVCYHVFARWVVDSQGGSQDASAEWAALVPELGPLALEQVRSGRSMDRHQALAALQTVLGLERSMAVLDRCVEGIGLLVPAEGRYRFLSKPIAGYLAARHAAAAHSGIDELAADPRALEPLSLAAGLNPNALVSSEWYPTALSTPIHPARPELALRRVQRLVRTVHAAALDAADVLAQTSDLALRLLFDESSTWVGERIAETLAVVAAEGGPLWTVLAPAIQARVRAPYSHLVRWYLAQFEHAVTPEEASVLERIRGERRSGNFSEAALREERAIYSAIRDRSPEVWHGALVHRDAGVRALAISVFVRAYSPDNDRTMWLLACFSDAGHAFFCDMPYLAAARALRDQQRTIRDPELDSHLLNWLHSASQRHQLGAMIAISPGVDDEGRMQVLRDNRGHRVPVEVLRELAAAGFADELEEGWSGWSDEQHSLQADPNPPDPRPPSAFARRRALRVLAAGGGDTVVRGLTEQLLGQTHLDADAVVFLSEVAVDTSDVAVALLRHEGHAQFPERACSLLGLVAARDSTVRDELLTRYERRKESQSRVMGDFPGGALAELAADDADAAAALADWLPASHNGLVRTWSVDTACYNVPVVREAAEEWARRTWKWMTEQNGAPTSGTALLGDIWPSWRDTEIVEHLLAWLVDEDAERVSGAISCLVLGPVAAHHQRELDALLPDALSRLRARPYELIRAIARVAQGGRLPDAAREPLEELLNDARGELLLLVCAALMGATDETRQQTLAGRAAEAWPCPTVMMRAPDATLERLVRAAPEAWTQRARELRDENQLLPMARVLRYLPASTVVELVADVPAHWMAAPIYISDVGVQAHRPLDEVARAAFDAGMEFEEAWPADAGEGP